MVPFVAVDSAIDVLVADYTPHSSAPGLSLYRCCHHSLLAVAADPCDDHVMSCSCPASLYQPPRKVSTGSDLGCPWGVVPSENTSGIEGKQRLWSGHERLVSVDDDDVGDLVECLAAKI